MAIDTVTQNPAVTAVLHYKSGSDFIPVSSTDKLPVDGAGGGGGGSDPNQQLTQTVNGNTYSLLLNSTNAVGAYSVVQIKNPTASGKQVLVYSISTLHSHLTNNIQFVAFKGIVDYTLSAVVPVNMNFGSTNTAVAEIRVATDNGSGLVLANAVDAAIVKPHEIGQVLKNPVLLNDGENLTVVCFTTNLAFSPSITFAEI